MRDRNNIDADVVILSSEILYYFDDEDGHPLTRVRKETCIKFREKWNGDGYDFLAVGEAYDEWRVQFKTCGEWYDVGVTRKANKAERVASKKANFYIAHGEWPSNI